MINHRFTLSPSLSLRAVVSTLPFTYTGADLYALCSDAMLKAVTRKSALIDAKVREYNENLQSREKASINSEGQPSDDTAPISVAWYLDHVATKDDIAVTVTEEDFLAAKAELIPSVSAEELAYYERVKETFEGSKDEKGTARGTAWGDDGKGEDLSSRERSFGHSGKGKGKGKAIEVNGNGHGRSALTLRPRQVFDGANDISVALSGDGVDSSAGNSVGKGKGKGKMKEFLGSNGASASYANVMKNVAADERAMAKQSRNGSNSEGEIKTGTAGNKSHDAASDVGNGVRASAVADEDADSDSDTSDFDDAQSKISRVNGLSRSASDAGSDVDSGSSSAGGG